MGKVDEALNALREIPESEKLSNAQLLFYYKMIDKWSEQGTPKELTNLPELLVDELFPEGFVKDTLYSLAGRKLVTLKSSENDKWYNLSIKTVKRKIEKTEEKEPTKEEVKSSGEIDKISLVIQYLNRLSGFSYKEETKEHRRYIERIFNDGYLFEDFKKVIAYKVKEWGQTEMRKFLRPSTLFAPSHFEEYLQAAKHAQPTQIKQRNMAKGAR